MADDLERRRCAELANAAIGDLQENGLPALIELLLRARAEVRSNHVITPAGRPTPYSEPENQPLQKHYPLGLRLDSDRDRAMVGYPRKGRYGD